MSIKNELFILNEHELECFKKATVVDDLLCSIQKYIEDKELKYYETVFLLVDLLTDIRRFYGAVEYICTKVGVTQKHMSCVVVLHRNCPEVLSEIVELGTPINVLYHRCLKNGKIKPSRIIKQKNKSIQANYAGLSTAKQFSTIALSQLDRIRDDDPDRILALQSVLKYVSDKLSKEINKK